MPTTPPDPDYFSEWREESLELARASERALVEFDMSEPEFDVAFSNGVPVTPTGGA